MKNKYKKNSKIIHIKKSTNSFMNNQNYIFGKTEKKIVLLKFLIENYFIFTIGFINLIMNILRGILKIIVMIFIVILSLITGYIAFLSNTKYSYIGIFLIVCIIYIIINILIGNNIGRKFLKYYLDKCYSFLNKFIQNIEVDKSNVSTSFKSFILNKTKGIRKINLLILIFRSIFTFPIFIIYYLFITQYIRGFKILKITPGNGILQKFDNISNFSANNKYYKITSKIGMK